MLLKRSGMRGALSMLEKREMVSTRKKNCNTHHLKTTTTNNTNTRTMDDKQRVAKRGLRDINVNVSWATGKLFLFFLIFNSTNNYFEQTTCTMGDE